MEIALAHGFGYGCRSDDYRALAPLVFADLNWKAPDWVRHAAFVEKHRPQFAVAPDVLALDDLTATVRYAERLAQWAERIIIVPKIAGMMEALSAAREPWMVIGYSVPTAYGGADALLMWEMAGWPVHLLGGTPQKQMLLAHYLNVVSADGNAASGAARHGVYWSAGHWVTRDRNLPKGPDLPYRAFERSCSNIVQAWQVLTGGA